jgi:hypothetical protein
METSPVRLLGRSHIKNLMGAKANTSEAANSLLKVLRILLAHAVDIGMLDSNPAIGVKRYPVRSEGFHTWSETEVAQFGTIQSARQPVTMAPATSRRPTRSHGRRCCVTVERENVQVRMIAAQTSPLWPRFDGQSQ